MKKLSKIFLSGVILASISFTSCFNEVFYNIKQDIAPEDSTVKGPITSICRYTIDGEEYLFLAANKGLRYKKVTTGNERIQTSGINTSWDIYNSLPFSLHKYAYYNGSGDSTEANSGHTGQSILKVLADETTLYIVTVEFNQDEEEGVSIPSTVHIWANQLTLKNNLPAAKNDWIEISFPDFIDSDGKTSNNYFPYREDAYNNLWFNNYNVFSTNAPKKEHRKVFIRSGDKKYFELSGTASPVDITDTVYALDETGNPITTDKTNENGTISTVAEQIKNAPKDDIDSAAYIGNKLYFFDSIAVTTNETFENDANYIYFAEPKKMENGEYEQRGAYDPSHLMSKYIKCFDGTKILPDYLLNAGEPVSCLTATKDSLLIGRADYSFSSSTSGGITKTSLSDNGEPGKELEPFISNAAIQLSTSYLIFTLLAADPSKPEDDGIIYSSIIFKGAGSSSGVSYDNIGLWAYYPDRKNWNCE